MMCKVLHCFWSQCSSLLFLTNLDAVVRPTHGLVPDNKQHLQHTSIYVPTGFRTRIPRKRAAADPRIKPRGY
jgi:hypothetical protein